MKHCAWPTLFLVNKTLLEESQFLYLHIYIIYILSMAALCYSERTEHRRQRSYCPKNPALFIWPFQKKICQPLLHYLKWWGFFVLGFFCFLFFYLFTCAYIVWVISPPCPPPYPSSPPLLSFR
jgi:drug/metabolite transporter (DMT)-like permease